MRIIILGAGRVGESVAASLVSEQNDITVIDPAADRLRDLEDRLDLRGVQGNGAEPSVLRRAGADDADMLIACAALDETNLVACKIAHDVFGIHTTIARLRSPEFPEGGELLCKTGFSVDHVICPEESVVRYIQQLIDYPEALQVLEFSQGRAHLVAVRAVAGSPLVNHSIGEIQRALSGCADARGGDLPPRLPRCPWTRKRGCCPATKCLCWPTRKRSASLWRPSTAWKSPCAAS
jgi:trk system potassium uptake protein TrkA